MPEKIKPMKVLIVASECYPLIKTGGLADVIGALPLALTAAGVDVRVLLPGFPAIRKALKKSKKVTSFKGLASTPVNLVMGTATTGVSVLMLDAPDQYDIAGNPYMEGMAERAGNDIRFATLAHAAALLADGTLTGWRPDIIHTHDWQAGLTAAYLSQTKGPHPKTVFTIHNLAFQGLFPASRLRTLSLPDSLFHKDGLEYWDQINFLKGGVVYSDAVTTVSPTYAREIQTEDQGMGLHGLMKKRNNALSGIVNGIDTRVWNPEADESLSAPFGTRSPKGKTRNKAALQKQMGLNVDADAPLFCVISRLTEQKGLDLLLNAISHITGMGGQLAVLGSGHASFEEGYRNAAARNKGRVATFIGYDEPLAHQIQAGSDFILVPSRFEPCGLTQLCGLRYGTVPIVARTGGLADTIIDANEAALAVGAATGIQFSPVSQEALGFALDRAFALYADKTAFNSVRRAAMRQDVSWDVPAGKYLALYRSLMAGA